MLFLFKQTRGKGVKVRAMKLESYKVWMSFLLIFLFEAATGSSSLAQSLETHSGSRPPISESTAMLMFGISLVLLGGILHRRSKATHNRAVYRSSGQLSVRLNDR